MKERLLQRVTADLRLNDLLRLKADSPAAMAADGLAFGESYPPLPTNGVSLHLPRYGASS
jgi:hypothetical protein